MFYQQVEGFLALLDYSLDTKRRRHVVGGILMSVALLFGGLSFTTMTIKEVKGAEEDE